MPSLRHRSSLRRMTLRDPAQSHRAASSLELLFDLVFVVGVSFASQALHHDLVEGHVLPGIVFYVMGFFGLWWAWLNFTWFASSYDTDDWLYRVVTIVQMGGALTYAAGLPGLMNPEHPTFVLGVTGYMIMRLAMAFQWFRASLSEPRTRITTLRYGFGVIVVQVFWLALLIVPTAWAVPTFCLGIVLELAVPIFSESRGMTFWHPGHIAERYGLFTLIVLGEALLASTNAVVEVGASTSHVGGLVLLAATSLVIITCFWWLYFAFPQHELLTSNGTAMRWGFGHFGIFAAAGALSAGIEIAIDQSDATTEISATTAAFALCVPVAVFVFVVWLLVLRRRTSTRVSATVLVLVASIVVAGFVPFSLQVVAALLVVALVVVVSGGDRGAVARTSASVLGSRAAGSARS